MDTNARVAALLRDLAAVQTSKQSMWGYKRAAASVLNLDEPIESYVQADGTLSKIPNVGPKSEPVILEAIRTGTSPIVERVISTSGQHPDIDRRQGLRTNFLSRAQVVAALRNKNLKGAYWLTTMVISRCIRSGATAIRQFESIAASCIARGYTFCAVTDHSYGFKIARGVSMADLKKQQREIDAVNRKYRGQFRIIKGTEANIRADGSVDMTRHELQQLELVVAANWNAVFAAAEQANVAVEIDGDPSRQDIDFELAKRALKAGCLFALDSDAHSTGDLVFAETAIAHARLAGVPKDRIINCWDVDRVMNWLHR